MREPTSHPLRVLFLTLEFRHGTFSGNGVLSSSQAHGLAKAGHAVLVVSGCPDDVSHDEESANLSDALPAAGEVSVRTLHVPGTKWGVLTSQCPWRELAESAQLATALHAQIAAFAPHVVLGIDWHVTPTWRALRKRVWPSVSSDPEPLDAHATSPSAYPPFVYSNYRVFARDGGRTHATMEREAVEAAVSTIALCQVDADYVCEELSPVGAAVAPRVVIAPLREDIHRLATTPTTTQMTQTTQLCDTQSTATEPWRLDIPSDEYFNHRRLLTCCVRLSPEKEPESFVRLCAELVRRGVLLDGSKHELVPVLCASTKGAYADAVRAEFLSVTKTRGLVCSDFLDADGMERMYRRTCLNVHPCVYDAYGMTVVEAAAFGAPSCVQRGDLVGCAALLRQSEMEFIPVDWTLNSEADLMTTESSPTDDHVADVVEGYLRAGWDGVHAGDSLRSIGERARVRAVGYDLLSCGKATGSILSAAVNSGTNSCCRWRLPDAAEQKRLAPLWRSASLAVWHDDTWRMIRSGDGASGEENENDGVLKPKPMLPAGTYVVVTAHNPMGTVTEHAVNEANARDLAHAVRVMTPAPAAVMPTLSVDPIGGFETWHEPGLAVKLNHGNGAMTMKKNDDAMMTALTRLARRYGQAAVYTLTCDVHGGMRIAVTPVFPGLEGLACAGVAARETPLPASMPRSPL